MNTLLLPATDFTVEIASGLIKKGELVAFPTETVYGLGANALNGEAVSNVYAVKGRPPDNPLIVHLKDAGELGKYAEVTPLAEALVKAFWPGALTVILPKKDVLPDQTTAGLKTAAFRVPDNAVAARLLQLARVPICAPSANKSGRPSPTAARHVLEDFDGEIPLILDGGLCAKGLESTVVDATGTAARILRPGFVTEDDIRAAGIPFDPSLPLGGVVMSPGTKYRHYAPYAPVKIIYGTVDEMIEQCVKTNKGAFFVPTAVAERLPKELWERVVPSGESAEDAARLLFAALRLLDDLNPRVILAAGVEEVGIGVAYMNRLRKAAGR